MASAAAPPGPQTTELRLRLLHGPGAQGRGAPYALRLKAQASTTVLAKSGHYLLVPTPKEADSAASNTWAQVLKDEAFKAEVLSRTPLRRIGQPKEVAGESA